ncbi:Asp/Glu/hydantoin racemase [Paenibacillaceae bacterium]|nr:Asp/Glu/hydantoin racemase [Paenibacillaceae bacterium]
MKKRIGMLTPSSNTVLEPVTSAMLHGIADVSAHFSRFKVTELTLTSKAASQFAIEPMLEAAYELADAKVDVIAYNGTSGGWVGFENDIRLCEKIKEETGIPATTSVLALNERFKAYNVKKFGIVSPAEKQIVERIIGNYAKLDLQCEASVCLGVTDNYACALIDEAAVKRMVREIAVPGVEAITTFGTNLWAAHLVEELERELDILILDTISVVVWQCLKMLDISPTAVTGWGRLFDREY